MTRKPLLAGLVLIPAILLALVAAEMWLGAPPADVEQLALLLTVSGAGSFLLAIAAVRWASGRLGSLHLRIAAAYVAGMLVVLLNVAYISWMMFLSGHDLSLLSLMLGFATVVSLAFGLSVSGALTAQLRHLSQVAARLAEGDLAARTQATGNDEIAMLGRTLDAMAVELQAAFARERKLEAGRRELIAAVSHDLRTPLATTRAMVEAICDGVITDPTEIQKYTLLMRREVEHVSQLIDDLFELSQIESGALRLQLEPTPIGELVADTIEAYEAQAQERDIWIERAAGPALPSVIADAPRLQRVLRNLIDNALRYTPAGGRVRIEARVDGAAARVTITDDGPGVPVEDLERVFDRFYRAEPARRRADGAPGRPAGAGLGLAIARGLIQAHGGQIWAEPIPDGGTAFHFTVPLADARAG